MPTLIGLEGNNDYRLFVLGDGTLHFHDTGDERGSREEYINCVLALSFGHFLEHVLPKEFLNTRHDVLGAAEVDAAKWAHVWLFFLLSGAFGLTHEQRPDSEGEDRKPEVAVQFPKPRFHELVVAVQLCLRSLVLFVVLPHHLDDLGPADANPLIELMRKRNDARGGLFLLRPAKRGGKEVVTDADFPRRTRHGFLHGKKTFLDLVHQSLLK